MTVTQLATPLHQRHIQVVRGNKVARKCLTESNGTPAMYLGHMNVCYALIIYLFLVFGLLRRHTASDSINSVLISFVLTNLIFKALN